nr:ion transporter [Actibacterium sp. 188UL27-1]
MSRARILAIIDGTSPEDGPYMAIAVKTLIIASAVVIALETIPDLANRYGKVMRQAEYVFVSLFILEYGIRVVCAPRPVRYIFSFWGLIDFLACVPALLLLMPDLAAVRVLRLLRLVRVLKLLRLRTAMARLEHALWQVRDELILFSVLALLMLYLAAVGIYHLEHNAQPDVFTSIPASLWWAMATLTTVGYGDAYPITVGGKIFTACVLLIGLGIVAVPVGLVTSALLSADQHLRKSDKNSQGDDDDI